MGAKPATGSAITVQELDAGLVPGGREAEYRTTSDLGSFTPAGGFDSRYLLLNALGHSFDETTGGVSGGLVTLTGYTDLASESRRCSRRTSTRAT